MIDPQVFDGRADTQRLRHLVNLLVIAPDLTEVQDLLYEMDEHVDLLIEKVQEELYG